MKKSILSLLAALVLGGCAKDVDFGMVDDISFSPSATVPVLNAKLTLEDLVADESGVLQVDSTNAMRIYFRQDSVFNYTNTQLLQVPDQKPIPLVLNEALPFLRVGLGLGTIAGAELFDVFFKTGRLALKVDASGPAPTAIDFRLTWHNAQVNGQVLDTVFSLAPGQTQLLDSAFLIGAIVDLTAGGQGVNFIDLELAIENPADIPSGFNYNCEIGLRNLEVDAATGYFGNRVVNAPNGDFRFEIPGLENFSGGFALTNPSLKLIVTSSTGIPLDIHTNFTGENRDRERLRLDALAFRLASASAVGQSIVSTYLLDANTSNVAEFLSLLPQQILYSGFAEVNPMGKTSTANFISADSRVVVDFEADIPLELRLENMRFRQTIEDVALSFDQSELFESMTLYFRSVNEIPFDLGVSIAFLDSVTGDSINGTFLQILSPAQVDANGRVIAPYRGDDEVVLDAAQIAALMRSSALRFEARLSTDNQGQQEVKMYSDYSLQLQMAIDAKLNVRVDEL